MTLASTCKFSLSNKLDVMEISTISINYSHTMTHTHIYDLPCEMTSHILSFLSHFNEISRRPSIHRISKTFNAIAKRVFDPSSYAIIYACNKGYTEIVRMLLADERINPATMSNRALIRACRKGHRDIVTLLLNDKRIDLTACGNRALKSSCARGHLETVRILLKDERIDPSYDNNAALWTARDHHHYNTMELLMEHMDDKASRE